MGLLYSYTRDYFNKIKDYFNKIEFLIPQIKSNQTEDDIRLIIQSHVLPWSKCTFSYYISSLYKKTPSLNEEFLSKRQKVEFTNQTMKYINYFSKIFIMKNSLFIPSQKFMKIYLTIKQ